MDYLAFALLGFGLILVLVGLLLQNNQEKHTLAFPKPPYTPEIPLAKASKDSPIPAREPSIAVRVAKQNPKLFSKEAYLYLDHSGKSHYSTDEVDFNLENVSSIRRFGKGNFSYDGFAFYFTYPSGQQNFPLESLEQIAFYPNCIVLVPKEKLPTALLFLDETNSIRQTLQTFRTDNGN